eukprot:CAMPEP_0198276124 /NCGR_PEP_ID=MMETSP1447-20131203/65143_1 /TAXON_ID=420782 /ORGANISM="Chaetoceros dichaeta, Strain CCMP1751" /LENGTH=341 /DNA_ID=CAMNT_0043971045 /DNA_START=191 /DNA_END=1218 /DNA_ORIENTATION=-
MTLVQYIISSLTRYGLQWAFALAPLPAYLPQYWALCKSSQDPILQSKVPKTLGGVGMKRQPSFNGGISCYAECGVSSSSLSVSSNTNMTMTMQQSCCSPIVNNNNNNNSKSGSASSTSGEGGFSPVAILILLLSHTLRLLYCCGSAIVVPIPIDGSDGITRSVDEVRLDLVMQSMVMIGVQLFLLSAVTRSRRTAFKKELSPPNSNPTSNPTPTSLPPTPPNNDPPTYPKNHSDGSTDPPNTGTGTHSDNTSNSSSYSQSPHPDSAVSTSTHTTPSAASPFPEYIRPTRILPRRAATYAELQTEGYDGPESGDGVGMVYGGSSEDGVFCVIGERYGRERRF